MNVVFDKNASTQRYADDLIGAAQKLERAARFLKEQAKTVRQYGLLRVEHPIYREAQSAYVLAVANDAANDIMNGGS